MAKKLFNIDDLFSNPAPEKAAQPVQPAQVEEEGTAKTTAAKPVASVQEPSEAPKTVQTQKKQANKQTSKQVSAESPKSKHTFELPNDVWADFEILLFVLQQQGNKKTQNGYITELLQRAAEENRDLIDRFKKMSGAR